ncbi:unnamed protein product [Ceutorhynchus assimilis]|uniref:Protein sleepless n=1 Tax=Ceutorhynchus assimilis TaxID=467358 RepID=A0A9N9MEN1_9CUCU|nr:unnamed protein product [Ceutorhynchus assimilis]
MAGYKRAVFLGIFCTVFFSSEEVLSQQEADRVIYTSEDYWKNETPLQCYDCNSEYDPRCGDPFNPYSIGVVNCSEQKPPEHLINPELHPNQKLKPTVCRKIVQKVEGYKRVIRECGYIQDKRDDKDCVRRTGTINVEVHYCACTGSLCNDGTQKRLSSQIYYLGLVFAGLTITKCIF